MNQGRGYFECPRTPLHWTAREEKEGVEVVLGVSPVLWGFWQISRSQLLLVKTSASGVKGWMKWVFTTSEKSQEFPRAPTSARWMFFFFIVALFWYFVLFVFCPRFYFCATPIHFLYLYRAFLLHLSPVSPCCSWYQNSSLLLHWDAEPLIQIASSYKCVNSEHARTDPPSASTHTHTYTKTTLRQQWNRRQRRTLLRNSCV